MMMRGSSDYAHFTTIDLPSKNFPFEYSKWRFPGHTRTLNFYPYPLDLLFMYQYYIDNYHLKIKLRRSGMDPLKRKLENRYTSASSHYSFKHTDTRKILSVVKSRFPCELFAREDEIVCGSFFSVINSRNSE